MIGIYKRFRSLKAASTKNSASHVFVIPEPFRGPDYSYEVQMSKNRFLRTLGVQTVFSNGWTGLDKIWAWLDSTFGCPDPLPPFRNKIRLLNQRRCPSPQAYIQD